MNYEDLISIETPIKAKYDNHLVPEIVQLITYYLFEHPEKYEIYMNPRVTVNGLLKHLASYERLRLKMELNTKFLIESIIEYVEVINGK